MICKSFCTGIEMLFGALLIVFCMCFSFILALFIRKRLFINIIIELGSPPAVLKEGLGS